jgi:hypothetical protein
MENAKYNAVKTTPKAASACHLAGFRNPFRELGVFGRVMRQSHGRNA